jgi:hypothetical protein
MTPVAPSTPDLVVQVHGTFAARGEDRGESWWQVGSECYEGIGSRLPSQVQLTQENEVFHWSGENSERARIKAASDLLSKMRGLEKQGRHYHLIGHSHGGSVIWHALRMATLNRVELGKLRSWTTVGTPYLRHTLNRSTRFTNLIRVVLGLALVKPAFTTGVKFFDLVFRPQHSVWLGADGNLPDRFTLYETPVLRILEMLHVPVVHTSNGVRIGSYEAAAGASHFHFLLTNPLGWLMVALTLIVIMIYLNLAAFFLRPVIESWQVWAEARLEQQAKVQFASRWLGVWSPEDEAINGLRATLDLSVEFVSKMAPQDRVLFSDYATIAMQPYYWVMTPVFNRLLRPFLDRMVRSFVVKSAQGNNRPGTEVVEVSVAPWPVEPTALPIPIPDWFNEQLVHAANEAAIQVVPKMRALLTAPSFTVGLAAFGESSNGAELVHTSYFDHDEVLDLLAMHVSGSSEVLEWHLLGVAPRHRELAQWLSEAKLRVGNQWFAWQLEKSSHGAAAEPGRDAARKAERKQDSIVLVQRGMRPRRRTDLSKAA